MKGSVPTIIHLVNLLALLLLGVMVLFAGSVSTASVVLLVPVLVLICVYWRYRANPNFAAAYLGLSMAVLGWVLLCENIVAIDNLLGSRITKQLTLGGRLQAYVDTNLQSPQRDFYLEPCCDDPLSWYYRPGSTYRNTFDCETCNVPYEVVVDETGYLNRAVGLIAGGGQIDMFVAGDSVLQGMGVPSVMEFLRDQLPVTLWNYSVAGYGPRQKISALSAYALPKQPKWLVLEFYPRNDVSDAIIADICEDLQDFRHCFGAIEPAHRLVRHPVYHTMVRVPANVSGITAYYAAQNFTLATTRYVINTFKRVIKTGVAAETQPREVEYEPDRPEIGFLAASQDIHVRPEKFFDWVTAGIPLVHRQYERLVEQIGVMHNKPRVILLYNPTPYELYCDILTGRNAEYDRIAEFLYDAQRTFARRHGWEFLDLTAPLRRELQVSKTWLYGRYDGSHWSLQGTALVASVLRGELLKTIKGE